MPVVKRYGGGEQIVFSDYASINFTDTGMLLLEGQRVTATAQQINALSGLIDAEGNIRLVNTVWDDLRFPASGINPPGAAADPTVDTTDGRLVFSASATNTIAMQVQMPHSWKEGSTIEPHIHWSPTDANAGNVKWECKYKLAGVNEAFPAEWTTITVVDAADGADQHQIADLPSIAMTGQKLSCMLLMIVSRLGGDPQDTYAATCKLNEVDIHYEIDSLGSDEEYIK